MPHDTKSATAEDVARLLLKKPENVEYFAGLKDDEQNQAAGVKAVHGLLDPFGEFAQRIIIGYKVFICNSPSTMARDVVDHAIRLALEMSTYK